MLCVHKGVVFKLVSTMFKFFCCGGYDLIVFLVATFKVSKAKINILRFIQVQNE